MSGKRTGRAAPRTIVIKVIGAQVQKSQQGHGIGQGNDAPEKAASVWVKQPAERQAQRQAGRQAERQAERPIERQAQRRRPPDGRRWPAQAPGWRARGWTGPGDCSRKCVGQGGRWPPRCAQSPPDGGFRARGQGGHRRRAGQESAVAGSHRRIGPGQLHRFHRHRQRTQRSPGRRHRRGHPAWP